MASYPRKFREKIALHAQKQAEETAAFEAIINETRQATSRAPGTSSLQQPINSHHGRSLPDVHQLASNNNSINLANILDNLAEMRKSPDGNSSKLRRRERSASPNDSLQKKPVLYDRHRQSSPYGSVGNNYLSPTLNDGSWRRATSDSAIHANVSAMQINDSGTFNAQSGNEGVKMVNGSGAEVSYNSHPPICITQSHPLPLSTTEINTNSVIPYGPNSGSLPDLSIMNFSSPSSNPVDMPYSTGNNSLATRRAETLQRHTLPEPLVFTHGTSNHLLAGGSAIVNSCQADSQSPLRLDSSSVFSPLLSPQPIITLTDVSSGENCGRDEILYSEDLDALQEYIFNMQSPMVSLSPSFFRQQSDSSNIMFQSCGELQSAAVHPLTHRNPLNTGVSVNSGKSVLSNNPTSQPSNQPTDGASNAAKIASTQSFQQQQNQPSATRQQPIAPRQPPVTSQQYVIQPKQMSTSDKHTGQQPSQQYQLQTVLQLNRLQQGMPQQQAQPLLQQQLNTHQLQQVQAIYLQQQQAQSVCQQQQQQVIQQQGQFMPVGMQPLHPASVIQYQTFPQQTIVCQTSAGGSFAPKGDVVVPIMESRLKTELDAAVSLHSSEHQHQGLQLHLASTSCVNGISDNSQPSPILKPPPAYVDRNRDWADMSTDLTSSGNQTTDIAPVGSAITFNTGDLISPLVTGVDLLSGISEAEFLTAEDAFSLGLDPLAMEELKMLTESASLIDDPDVENSFRQDRAFDIHRQ